MNESKPVRLPENHVFGVISGSESAERAVSELQAAGFTQTTILRGDDVAEEIDPKGETSGPFKKLVRAVQDHLSEESGYFAQYQEEARAGKDVVAVQVEDRDAADAAKEVLQKHGAVNLRYFGGFAVTDLTPESNPSTRSEESPDRMTRG